MAIQTIYTSTTPPAVPGMAWVSSRNSCTTAVNYEASSEIPFGVFVQRAASPNELLRPRMLLLASGTAPLLGATGHTHALSPEFDLGLIGAKPKVALDVYKAGIMWMLCEQDMVVGDPVFTRFATGSGGAQRGIVRKTDDSTTALRVKGATVYANSVAVTIFEQTQKVVAVEFDMLLHTTLASL